MFRNKLSPDDVFTPRSPNVNRDMYVARPDLEDALRRALLGSKNLIVHGESGSGKTWLYKNVFDANDVHYETVNLSKASLSGSLSSAFEEKLGKIAPVEKTSEVRAGEASVRPFNTGVSKSGSDHYSINLQGPFERLLMAIRGQAKKKTSVLVYENVEQVLSIDSIVKSISDTVILLDDDDLSKYNVKICIVGVPQDIRDYLSRSSNNITTINNRTIEIPEVSRLNESEAKSIAKKGFEDRLKYNISVEKNKFYNEICWNSDRIAQYVHEYCLSIAHEASQNGGVIDEGVVDRGKRNWIDQTLSADYGSIDSRMNARDTKAGRRNQVLYSIGLCETHDFRTSDIEKILRSEFPKGTGGVSLNVSGMLTELSSGSQPILRRTPKGDAFRFTTPRYRMCLRAMLRKRPDEKVEKITLS